MLPWTGQQLSSLQVRDIFTNHNPHKFVGSLVLKWNAALQAALGVVPVTAERVSRVYCCHQQCSFYVPVSPFFYLWAGSKTQMQETRAFQL